MKWLGGLILDWFLGKLAGLLYALFVRRLERREDKKQSEASVKPLKDAQTAEDIDAATDDALSGF